MKTIMIYDQMGMEDLQFYVFDGDLSHFDGVYINSAAGDEELMTALNNIIYDDDGKKRNVALSKFPVDAIDSETKVIVSGMLP